MDARDLEMEFRRFSDRQTFYGQWYPQQDEVLYRNYFYDKRDGFFIECGACDGLVDTCCLFFEKRGWRGINIEPSDVAYERLVVNRPNCLNLQIGLGDKDSSMKFTKAVKNGYGGGCIKWNKVFKQEVINEGFTFEETEIEVLTYRTLMPKYDVVNVDLFVLDTDGYELQVLEGMIGSVSLPKVFCIEYSLLKDDSLEKLKKLLGQMGYRFDFISYNNAFFAMPEVPEREWWGVTPNMVYN